MPLVETRLLALQIAALLPSPAQGREELARLIADAAVIVEYLGAALGQEAVVGLRKATLDLARDLGDAGDVHELVSRAQQLLNFLSDPAVPPPVPEGR